MQYTALTPPPDLATLARKQQHFVHLLQCISQKMNRTSYFFRLLGNGKDALNTMLGIDYNSMQDILIDCKIYNRELGRIDKKVLTSLVDKVGYGANLVKFTLYSPTKKRENLDLLMLGIPSVSIPRPKQQYQKGSLVKEFPSYTLSEEELDLIQLLNSPSSSGEERDKDKSNNNNNEKDKGQDDPSSLEEFVRDISQLFNAYCPSSVLSTLEPNIISCLTKFLKTSTPKEREEMKLMTVCDDENEFVKKYLNQTSTRLRIALTDEISQSKRVFPIENKRGGFTKLVVCPKTKTVDNFLVEARKSRWIDELLDDEVQVNGMTTYLFKHHPHLFLEDNARVTREIPTENTRALMSEIGLLGWQQETLRSWMRIFWNIKLGTNGKEEEQLEAEVGNKSVDHIEFHTHIHYGPKKDPQYIRYYHADLPTEICTEVEMHLNNIFNDNVQQTTYNDVPVLDYTSPSNKQGITVVLGGDHGDSCFFYHAKLNLSSPQTRKEIGELSYECPTVPISYMEGRDAYEVLENTVAKKISENIKQVQNGCIIIVYDSTNIKGGHKKAYLVAKTILMETVHLHPPEKPASIKYFCKDDSEEHTLQLTDKILKVDAWKLQIKKIISNFYDNYFGDLKFLCTTAGMEGSSSCWCPLCEKSKSQFNCSKESTKDSKRTKRKLEEAYLAFELKSQTSASVNNVRGVNLPQLFETMDIENFIIPVLHSPMGLVNKVCESMLFWVIYDCIELPDEGSELRRAYRNANRSLEQQQDELRQRKTQYEKGDARINEAQKKKNEALKKKAAAKKMFDRFSNTYKLKEGAYHSRLEEIYRRVSVLRQVYHGGEFNGVDCIRIMENADLIVDGIAEVVNGMMSNEPDEGMFETKASMKATCRKFKLLLVILSAIWSRIRGVEHGLLPSAEDVNILRNDLDAGKRLWLDLGLSTHQPKWHLTFDGELELQYEKKGGLADKCEDVIEKMHQTFGKLRRRYSRVQNFKQRHLLIRKEWRRLRHHRCRKIVAEFHSRKKHHQNTTRKRRAINNQLGIREAKRMKRSDCAATIQRELDVEEEQRRIVNSLTSLS